MLVIKILKNVYVYLNCILVSVCWSIKLLTIWSQGKSNFFQFKISLKLNYDFSGFEILSDVLFLKLISSLAVTCKMSMHEKWFSFSCGMNQIKSTLNNCQQAMISLMTLETHIFSIKSITQNNGPGNFNRCWPIDHSNETIMYSPFLLLLNIHCKTIKLTTRSHKVQL